MSPTVPSVEPDLNVTPLVDVVLVLLIIFMVVAPRLERDVPVNLPTVVNTDAVRAAGDDAVKVTVAAGGQLYVDGEPYTLDAAMEVLQAAHAAEPLRRLVLRGDESLTYGQVRAVCARVRQVGFPGVALLVDERHRHADGDRDTAGG